MRALHGPQTLTAHSWRRISVQRVYYIFENVQECIRKIKAR